MRVHDTRTGQLLHTFDGQEAAITTVAVNRDGTRLASGGQNGSLLLYDLEKNSLVGTLIGHRQSIRAAEFFSYGNQLISISGDHRILLWDTEKKRLLQTLSGEADESFVGVHLSADGQRFASALSFGRIGIWEGV